MTDYHTHPFSELVGGAKHKGLRTPLCRIGNKRNFAKLLDFIVPAHDRYVECFTGSGAFYWHKAPAKTEVVNDLDDDVISLFRLIKKAPVDLSQYPQDINTIDKAKAFWVKKPTTVPQKLTHLILSACSGFMGKRIKKPGDIARVANPYNKLKNIAKYKERMNKTTVEHMDYAKLIKKYNRPDTFFFLDPPYENSDGFDYAEEKGFDFERLRKTVDSIKGNWLMTINDSPRIRKLFHGYHQAHILIKGRKRRGLQKAIGSADRPELLISNYPLPSGWQKHLGSLVAN